MILTYWHHFEWAATVGKMMWDVMGWGPTPTRRQFEAWREWRRWKNLPDEQLRALIQGTLDEMYPPSDEELERRFLQSARTMLTMFGGKFQGSELMDRKLREKGV